MLFHHLPGDLVSERRHVPHVVKLGDLLALGEVRGDRGNIHGISVPRRV
jgi:hypothetical protein